MTFTRAQLGNSNSTTGASGAPGINASLPGAPTIGNLLVVASYNSTGAITGPGAGFALAAEQGSVVKQQVYWKNADDVTQTLFNVQAGSGALGVQVFEFRPGAGPPASQTPDGSKADGVFWPGSAGPSGSPPGTITSPVATRSGEGLVVAVLGANGALTGFSPSAADLAAGWQATDGAHDVFGRGAFAWAPISLTAGVTSLALSPTWNVARTGHGMLVVFSPGSAPGSFIPQVINFS